MGERSKDLRSKTVGKIDVLQELPGAIDKSLNTMESKTVPSMHFPELFSGNNTNKSAFQPLKNPCLALNELRPGLEYKLLEQSGPVHMPTFKIAIDLDGQIFTGEGRYVSKKILHFNFDLKNLPKCIPEILLR